MNEIKTINLHITRATVVLPFVGSMHLCCWSKPFLKYSIFQILVASFHWQVLGVHINLGAPNLEPIGLGTYPFLVAT